MPLPDTIRVRLSSEEAGAISLTEVVVREMPLRELVEYMLPLAGKNTARIREFLKRGSLVSGASRFRWTGWEAAEEELAALLEGFPDPDPLRPFAAERCVRAVLRGAGRTVEIPREAGARTRALRRESFWDSLMEIAAAGRYSGYSYRHRADRFEVALEPEAAQRLRAAAGAVSYSTLRDLIGAIEWASVEFHVER